MRFQRLIIAFLITIGLFSSTSGAAFSQGRMAGGLSITICSPNGAHEIIIGANGKPVPAEHECENCCFIALDAHIAPRYFAPFSANQTRNVLPIVEISWREQFTATAQARAPPSVV
ncbi:MAG: hypothetical protein COA53_12645 [Rhodobacteraceae bacterium]|nr:MAG: hypothetical protein COA53_12645 [Paracoccaceae bacterium]